MTRTELDQVIAAIQRRGDPAYTTPSGAFLEHIANLATQLKIQAFADSCEAYVSAFPEVAPFIAARVPGILCNRYFTVLPGFDYEKFIQWSIRTSGWGKSLQTAFSSASDLDRAISQIREAVEKHA